MRSKYDQWKMTDPNEDPRWEQWFDENVDDLENMVEFIEKSHVEYHDFLIRKYEETFN